MVVMTLFGSGGGATMKSGKIYGVMLCACRTKIQIRLAMEVRGLCEFFLCHFTEKLLQCHCKSNGEDKNDGRFFYKFNTKMSFIC